jgi:hypothetical protein
MQVIKPTNSDGLYIQVDDDVFEELNSFKWHLRSSGSNYKNPLGLSYAVRSEGNKSIYMHKVIAGVFTFNNRKRVVTHIDGDTLNNQLNNLRITSQSKSQQHRRPNFNKSLK